MGQPRQAGVDVPGQGQRGLQVIGVGVRRALPGEGAPKEVVPQRRIGQLGVGQGSAVNFRIVRKPVRVQIVGLVVDAARSRAQRVVVAPLGEQHGTVGASDGGVSAAQAQAGSGIPILRRDKSGGITVGDRRRLIQVSEQARGGVSGQIAVRVRTGDGDILRPACQAAGSFAADQGGGSGVRHLRIRQLPRQAAGKAGTGDDLVAQAAGAVPQHLPEAGGLVGVVLPVHEAVRDIYMGGRAGQGTGGLRILLADRGVHQTDARQGISNPLGPLESAEQARILMVRPDLQVPDGIPAAVIGPELVVVDGPEHIALHSGNVSGLLRCGLPCRAGECGVQVLQVPQAGDVCGLFPAASGKEAVVRGRLAGAVDHQGAAFIGHLGGEFKVAAKGQIVRVRIVSVFKEIPELRAVLQGVQRPGIGVGPIDDPLVLHGAAVLGLLGFQRDGNVLIGQGHIQAHVFLFTCQGHRIGHPVGDLRPQGVLIVDVDDRGAQGDGGAALSGLAAEVPDHGVLVHPLGPGRRPPLLIEVLKIAAYRQGLPGEEHIHHAGTLRLVDDVEVPLPQGGFDGLPGQQVLHGGVLTVAVIDSDLGGPLLAGLCPRNDIHVLDPIPRLDHQPFQTLAALQQDGAILGRQIDLPGGVVQLRNPGLPEIPDDPHRRHRQQDHQNCYDDQHFHQREPMSIFPHRSSHTKHLNAKQSPFDVRSHQTGDLIPMLRRIPRTAARPDVPTPFRSQAPQMPQFYGFHPIFSAYGSPRWAKCAIFPSPSLCA